MDQAIPSSLLRHPESGYFDVKNESAASAVSWSAVAGGAFVAAAMALIMVALGAGFGLSAVSPWAGAGASAATIGAATVIWLVLMQVIPAALGGYVAGRLRTKWVDVHTDEVFFRDTAHGLMVWAVAVVIGAGLLASAAGSLIGATARAGGQAVAAAGAGVAATGSGGNAYFVDSLFRRDRPAASGDNTSPAPAAMANDTLARGTDPNANAEAARIFAYGLASGDFPVADRTYLTQMIVSRTGLSQADAERRLGSVLAQAAQAKAGAQEKADQARRAAAHSAFWTFFALLFGAFAASYAATIGGRQRDKVKPGTLATT